MTNKQSGIYRFLIISFFLLLANFSNAQPQYILKPFVLKGQLTNTKGLLTLVMYDSNYQALIDTIVPSATGKFYLETSKPKHPQRTSLYLDNKRLLEFFIAPGYMLTLKGDASDSASFAKTKKITGNGAQSNKYLSLLDKLVEPAPANQELKQFSEKDLLTFIKKDQQIKDSLVKLVFTKQVVADKLQKQFGNIARLDNQFNKLHLLVAYTNLHNYDLDKSVSFIGDNFDNKLLEQLDKPAHMASREFREHILTGDHVEFQSNIDALLDGPDKKFDYKLFIVDHTYSGKAREYALHKLIRDMFANPIKADSFHLYNWKADHYISTLQTVFYKTDLKLAIEERIEANLQAMLGKPAPAFALESDKGILYRLEDFKGKVIYLDFWASWCYPCRDEMPDFLILKNKFQQDDRIVFISIAINDENDTWKKAIEEDKPTWLQLHDKTDEYMRTFFVTSIPRFLIIDKNGNLANYNAPRPSSGAEIEALLRKEIER